MLGRVIEEKIPTIKQNMEQSLLSNISNH